MAWGQNLFQKPLGPRLGALAVRQQGKQSMTRVAGVFDHFQGLPLSSPAQEVLDSRKLVAIPGSDTTRQDAFDGAAVKPFEDLTTHDKSFQSPEGEQVLSCHFHDCLGELEPRQFVGVVDAKELEALNLLHYSPVHESLFVLCVLTNKLLSLSPFRTLSGPEVGQETKDRCSGDQLTIFYNSYNQL